MKNQLKNFPKIFIDRELKEEMEIASLYPSFSSFLRSLLKKEI